MSLGIRKKGGKGAKGSRSSRAYLDAVRGVSLVVVGLMVVVVHHDAGVVGEKSYLC